MTKDSISNYRTKVRGYKNASSPVNRVCGRIPRIPPESATDCVLRVLICKNEFLRLVGQIRSYGLYCSGQDTEVVLGFGPTKHLTGPHSTAPDPKILGDGIDRLSSVVQVTQIHYPTQ